MDKTKSLDRFIEAQEGIYAQALMEMKAGKKRSHWMWFIFPQVQGLGYSENAQHYALADLKEAAFFLRHPLLGSRLLEMCEVLLGLDSCDPTHIFGDPDNLKLRSSMTLFSCLPVTNPVFNQVLEKFFSGQKDLRTLNIIANKS